MILLHNKRVMQDKVGYELYFYIHKIIPNHTNIHEGSALALTSSYRKMFGLLGAQRIALHDK